MKPQIKILIVAAALLIITAGVVTYKKILEKFLPGHEGFSATPYWDFQQWSWGHGTKVPGSTNNPAVNPGGSITRAQAIAEALKHIDKDYNYLKPLVKIPLTGNQWAALLSFTYNLGPGNAVKLLPNINTRNNTALETQWKKYIYAGGIPNAGLASRRAAEWALWIKN